MTFCNKYIYSILDVREYWNIKLIYMCYLEKEITGVKTVEITVLNKEVSVVRIYFGKKSRITISKETFEAIQKKLGRKSLKGLRAKVSFSLRGPLNPERIEMGGISAFGLSERQLKNLGKFKKTKPWDTVSVRHSSQLLDVCTCCDSRCF